MKLVVTGTRGIPNIMGGVETHCEELFPRIAAKGIDTTIIRRKSYVHDSLSEWKGVKLLDIDTPKKKIIRSYHSYIQSYIKGKSIKSRYCSYSCYRPCPTYSAGKITWNESGFYTSWP